VENQKQKRERFRLWFPVLGNSAVSYIWHGYVVDIVLIVFSSLLALGCLKEPGGKCPTNFAFGVGSSFVPSSWRLFSIGLELIYLPDPLVKQGFPCRTMSYLHTRETLPFWGFVSVALLWWQRFPLLQQGRHHRYSLCVSFPRGMPIMRSL
jgi:hypothetical protein